ncbi:MAG: hypothetical protein GY729_10820 [Desulfobacteraceae bacterium]|nr:hypothetical protein [Desulfobacteraceae bacterium]
MAYDPEKYRDKREKVLGIQSRGISFGILSSLIALVILFGISFITVPGAVSYIKTKHLDDAIYKLENDAAWPANVVEQVNIMEGVKTVIKDKHDTRLVITFDRRIVQPSMFTVVFKKYDLTATLLNQVNHRQRQTTLKQEKELEAS